MKTKTASIVDSDLGRHVFGLAALASGVIMLVWHDESVHLLRPILNAQVGRIFVDAAAAAQMFGGAVIRFRPSAKAGAAVLGLVYFVFALLTVPEVIAAPKVYNSWGNFFEQFSLFTGALMVYARFSRVWGRETLDRIGRVLFGMCVASFTLEQAFYLGPTASLVPKWLPPNQMFWAVTTTVAFALAAVALLTNLMALRATRLLTAMLVIFGLFVWLPLLVSDPHSHTNWSEAAETFAIAGVAWILAGLLAERQIDERRNAIS